MSTSYDEKGTRKRKTPITILHENSRMVYADRSGDFFPALQTACNYLDEDVASQQRCKDVSKG